jgi:hypothetical protein
MNCGKAMTTCAVGAPHPPCRWNESFDFIDVRADSILLATVWDQVRGLAVLVAVGLYTFSTQFPAKYLSAATIECPLDGIALPYSVV